jgi:serine/threonine protein kinase
VARGEKATPASDIYGLGLVAYYTLTKTRLIRAATRSDMVRLQAKARSVRPGELPPGWPPRLRDAIVQCLQAEPADRYQSAETLAADLMLALWPGDQDATLLLDAERRQAARRWLSREAVFAVAGAAATALLLALLWWLLY